MSVRYYFFNLDRCKINRKIIPKIGEAWINDVSNAEELIKIFEDVRKKNRWSKYDRIAARADDDSVQVWYRHSERRPRR